MESCQAICPHCGRVNHIEGLAEVFTFVCRHCGEAVTGLAESTATPKFTLPQAPCGIISDNSALPIETDDLEFLFAVPARKSISDFNLLRGNESGHSTFALERWLGRKKVKLPSTFAAR